VNWWNSLNSLAPQAEQKLSRLLLAMLVIIHAALAITFKILFFSYYVSKEIGPPDPIPVENGSVDNVKRWLSGVMY
jgi:hypothetical protein